MIRDIWEFENRVNMGDFIGRKIKLKNLSDFHKKARLADGEIYTIIDGFAETAYFNRKDEQGMWAINNTYFDIVD